MALFAIHADGTCQLQRYTMNVTLGTPPQRFGLTIDSGSADTWVPAANSSGCAPSCPPGYSYDPSASSTIVDLDLVFNATYGLTPEFHMVGEYYNDTVGIGDARIADMTGAYCRYMSATLQTA
jgi:hypothetical protein